MDTNKIIILSKKGSKAFHKLLDEHIDKHMEYFNIHKIKSPSKEMIKKILKNY